MQYTLYSLLRKHGEVMSEKHSNSHLFFAALCVTRIKPGSLVISKSGYNKGPPPCFLVAKSSHLQQIDLFVEETIFLTVALLGHEALGHEALAMRPWP